MRIARWLGMLVAFAWLVAIGRANGRDTSDGPRRDAADQAFRSSLDGLADRCDSLGLKREAELTRAWLIRRDPARQYLFLPLPAASPSPIEAPTEASVHWWNHFREARKAQAARLVDLAREAAATQPALAYQWLHEALHEDPDLAVAREALGYRLGANGWTYAGDLIASSQGKAAMPELGLAARQYHRIDSPNFRILTDADEATGRRLARELEDFHCVWRQTFYDYWGDGPRLVRQLESGAPDARPRSEKHRIVWFRDREKYVSVLRKDEPRIEKTLGIYLEKRRTAFLYGDPDELRDSWLHEVTHQLFAETGRSITDVGLAGNVWVVEGLALHMESLRKQHDYAMVGGVDARRLQYARYRALTDKFYVPAAEFARLDRKSMQLDPNIGALYSQASGLTSYWMTADDGRYRSAFVDYVGLVYRGRDEPDSLVKLTGRSWNDVDTGYANYLLVSDADLEYCQQVVELVLCHSPISDEGFRHVPIGNLEWLDLGHTRVTDASALRLADARNLRKLTLEATGITAEGVAVVARLPDLEYLDLSQLPVDDACLAAVANLARLESLWLTGSRVTDAGLVHLAGLKQLKHLDVAGSAVTEAGLAGLRATLPLLNRE